MFTQIIIGALVVIIIALVIISLPLGYIKAPPDQAVIISGRRKEPKIVVGKSTMRIPFFERKDTLTLRIIDIDVKTAIPVPTADFIGVQVDATVNAKIPADNREMLLAASQNFLNMKPSEIAKVVQPVLEGNIREIIGKLELKRMVGDRQEFARLVKENAEPDLANLGLEIKTFNVQNFTDRQGVIQALGIENETKVKKDAAVSKALNAKIIREETARAEREANEAEVESKTAIAERENELRIKRAGLKQESDARQAEADAAYRIHEEAQRKQLEQTTVDAEIARTEREVELKRMQVEAEKERLEAEVSKKADADRYAAEQKAEAELYTRRKQAEAEKAELQAKAEAEAYQKQAASDAEAYQAAKDAEAAKARAEADRFAKEQEAAGIAALGEAEAKAIEAKGIAEAEAIDRKAQAMAKYGQAAILEMIVDALPALAHEVASPMASISNVSIIGNDAGKVADMSSSVPLVMAKVFESVKQTTGIDLADIVRADGAYAQVTKDVNLSVRSSVDDVDAAQIVQEGAKAVAEALE